MATQSGPTGLARRERKGSEKRAIGIKNIERMLPTSANHRYGGEAPPNIFAADLSFLSMEDSYCDIWDRLDVIDAATRSIFNVSLMSAAGNVTNQYELAWHTPGAIHNGVPVEVLDTIVVMARAYVGSPASAWAMSAVMKALNERGYMPETFPAPNKERRELSGSEKRTIARDVLRRIQPDSPLLDVGEEMDPKVFGAELDYMILENLYYDIWARTDGVDVRTRTIIALGLLMGVPSHDELRAFIPTALRNGITVPELEELMYQASVYLGFPTGLALRRTIAEALRDGNVTW
jgi:alkylhydroperoxidase/carboxymuconolactone decarboxylase family protein YurZ